MGLQNIRAAKLYERLGFEPYAVDERPLKLDDGTYMDELLTRWHVPG
ncbi:hypothetical protein [Sphingomonas parapaucimobilis]